MDGDTHEEDGFRDDGVSASLILVYLRIIRRGDMLAEKWMRNRGMCRGCCGVSD